jgi:UDP-N-acetylmuramoyl-L-alanyl-D-glutamate--2,6-diaminopimelate ligase
VFGAAAKSSLARRALAGRVIERGTHLAVLTCDEPDQPHLGASVHDVLDGFDRPHRAHIVPNRAAAIRYALDEAQSGDAVLIAGRGDRVSRPAHGCQAAYDDREVVCEWLYNRGQVRRTRPRLRVVG